MQQILAQAVQGGGLGMLGNPGDELGGYGAVDPSQNDPMGARDMTSKCVVPSVERGSY